MPKPRTRQGSALAVALFALIAAALTYLLYGAALGFPMLGHDTYPIILTNRIETAGDVFVLPFERLMDGRFRADYWRPILGLSFALDHQLWKLDPFGYHLTDLLLTAASAVVLFLLAARLLGRRCRWGPWLAGLVFLIHPAHWESLPIAARRGDLLVHLFSCLTLLTLLLPRPRGGRLAPLLPAFFAACAMGAKESAFVLPLLCLVAARAYAVERPAGAAWRQALWRCSPVFVVAALMLGLRLVILSALGGYRETGLTNLVRHFPLELGLLLPQPNLQASPWAWALLASLVLSLILCLRGRSCPAPSESGARISRTLLLGGTWLILMSLIYTVGGQRHSWYLVSQLGGLGLIVGALGQAVADELRRGAGRARWIPAWAAASLGGLLLLFASESPPLADYPQWRLATEQQNLFLNQLDKRIRRHPGERGLIETPPLPVKIAVPPGEPGIRGAQVLYDYTVQAWAEMHHPDRDIRVRFDDDERGRPSDVEEALVVLLSLRLKGARQLRQH